MSRRTALSQAVLKATDATLTTDNWQRIMVVCDLVKEDPEDNGKDVIQFLERRLEQKDANVILRAISLTIALAENCGSRLQQEISSKHFTHLLYDLIENKQVHLTLKIVIAHCIEQLAKSFKNDPSLKSMNDTYRNILKHHSELLKGDQTGSKPYVSLSDSNTTQHHHAHTDKKSNKEEEEEDKELAEVMRLSLQEYESTKQQQPVQQNEIPIPQKSNENQTSQLKRVKAMYDLNSKEQDELSFHKGDVIVVLEQVYRDWWRGSLHGKIGIFPLNYVTPIDQTMETTSVIKKEIEDKILNSKDKIDQLHYNLQNSKDTVTIIQDDSVNKLYGEITPMRPEITKLIGKYAKDRDELGSLHQILANAEATYNDIMKNATTTAYATVGQQPQQPQFTNIPQQYGKAPQQQQQQYNQVPQYTNNISYQTQPQPAIYQAPQALYQSPPPQRGQYQSPPPQQFPPQQPVPQYQPPQQQQFQNQQPPPSY
ncbi:class E vacuolar protein-sorting machinery protein Hse1p [Monosporozyma unispora]